MQAAVDAAVERFGGIDICINNASAINLVGTEALELKRFDLMQQINVRGSFAVTRSCLPHLREGTNPHILTLSPPPSRTMTRPNPSSMLPNTTFTDPSAQTASQGA